LGRDATNRFFFKFKFQECIFSFLSKFVLFLNTRFTRVIPDHYATFVYSNVANTETFSKMCGIFPRMAVCVCVCVYVYIYTSESGWKLKPNTLEADGRQYDCPTTCVFAQHSSAAFVSLHFQSCKEKFGTCLKNVVISIFFFMLKTL